jgi:hypothetical protein
MSPLPGTACSDCSDCEWYTRQTHLSRETELAERVVAGAPGPGRTLPDALVSNVKGAVTAVAQKLKKRPEKGIHLSIFKFVALLHVIFSLVYFILFLCLVILMPDLEKMLSGFFLFSCCAK